MIKVAAVLAQDGVGAEVGMGWTPGSGGVAMPKLMQEVCDPLPRLRGEDLQVGSDRMLGSHVFSVTEMGRFSNG